MDLVVNCLKCRFRVTLKCLKYVCSIVWHICKTMTKLNQAKFEIRYIMEMFPLFHFLKCRKKLKSEPSGKARAQIRITCVHHYTIAVPSHGQESWCRRILVRGVWSKHVYFYGGLRSLNFLSKINVCNIKIDGTNITPNYYIRVQMPHILWFKCQNLTLIKFLDYKCK